MTDPVPQTPVAEPALDPLRESEREREWRRLQPTRDRPAFARVASVQGWKLELRDVYDLSMGGVSVAIQPGETQGVQVGERVQVSLNLGQRTLQVMGEITHVSATPPTGEEPRRLGIVFVPGAGFMKGRVAVSTYLRSLLNL